MATPEPADIQMRIDLALGAVDEVSARVDEVIRQDETVRMEDVGADVYRLLSRLAEAVGNVAMAIRLLKEA